MKLLLGFNNPVIVTARGFLMATFEMKGNEVPKIFKLDPDQDCLFPAWLSPTGWEILFWGDLEPDHRQALELTGG